MLSNVRLSIYEEFVNDAISCVKSGVRTGCASEQDPIGVGMQTWPTLRYPLLGEFSALRFPRRKSLTTPKAGLGQKEGARKRTLSLVAEGAIRTCWDRLVEQYQHRLLRYLVYLAVKASRRGAPRWNRNQWTQAGTFPSRYDRQVIGH